MNIENEAKKEYRTYQMEIRKGHKYYHHIFHLLLEEH